MGLASEQIDTLCGLKGNEPLEHEKDKAGPEKERIAEHGKYQAVERRNGPLNVKSIKQSQNDTGC